MSEAEQECRWSLVKAYFHWRIAQRMYPLHNPRFVYDLGLGPLGGPNEAGNRLPLWSHDGMDNVYDHRLSIVR